MPVARQRLASSETRTSAMRSLGADLRHELEHDAHTVAQLTEIFGGEDRRSKGSQLANCRPAYPQAQAKEAAAPASGQR